MFDNASSYMNFVDLLNTGLTNAVFKQFTFVCLIISGTLNMRLLLLARFRPAVLRVPELSRALVVYLCFHCAGAILSLPYNAYVLIRFFYGNDDWRTPRSAYTLFCLGHWQNTYTAISPLAVLFLTMERCFIIKLATNPAKRERIERWLCRASIATLLAAFSASTGIYMSELPLDIDSLKLSNCESVSCLVVKWRNLPQMFFKAVHLVCLIISGTLNMRLLLLARFRPAVLRVPELSRALFVYLCFHCAGAILSLPYNAYVLIRFFYGNDDWRTPRSAYTLFCLGHWQNTYTAISPLAVLFLTMERCFIIKLATNPGKRERIERWLCRASIATLLAAFSASTGIYMSELPLDIDNLKLSNCESVSCLMVKWRNLPQMFFKGSVSFLNIFCCFYFLYTLRTFSAMKNLKNHLVIVTLCFAFCFDFVPAIVSIGFCIFGLGLISNVASTCTALDVCCCAIFYSLVFVPPRCLKRANASVGSTNEPKPSPSLQPPQQQHQRMRSFSLKPM
uniref:G_PROTEIN_RECEP_F1_2 domain-containing protein n=1 Tax=Globodera pallida TaxID=36090 RepID=A0A183BLQ9_GLOPA